VITEAVQAYRDDVAAGRYPSDSESYHLLRDTQSSFATIAERKRAMRR